MLFQSTLPRRERRGGLDTSGFRAAISIHAPAKGATTERVRQCRRILFQSTLPRRERPLPPAHPHLRHISIHAPAKGATKAVNLLTSLENISIHAPAKGATALRDARTGPRRISIHAPAKGATQGYVHGADAACISIHAPAKGATLSSRSHERPRCYFNPRSREGSDGGVKGIFGVIIAISIHAPAKGATLQRICPIDLQREISIHAPAKGATPLIPAAASFG